jgi:hypothetical protein
LDVVDNDIDFDGIVSDRSFSVVNDPLSDDIDNISGGCVIEFRLEIVG